MSNVACPHYAPPNATGLTFLCRGCGAEVSNPTNMQAQSAGMVKPGGAPRTINQHGANPSRKLNS